MIEYVGNVQIDPCADFFWQPCHFNTFFYFFYLSLTVRAKSKASVHALTLRLLKKRGEPLCSQAKITARQERTLSFSLYINPQSVFGLFYQCGRKYCACEDSI